jgi:hypothetical protein
LKVNEYSIAIPLNGGMFTTQICNTQLMNLGNNSTGIDKHWGVV